MRAVHTESPLAKIFVRVSDRFLNLWCSSTWKTILAKNNILTSFLISVCNFNIIKEVFNIEIKIPKEVRQHKETIFFGLSTRQFFCAVAAVGIAVVVYLGLGPVLGQETASWLCVLAAAPMAVAGFFSYNSLTLEQFAWAFLKSEILCAGGRRFVSENFYYTMLHRKEAIDFD